MNKNHLAIIAPVVGIFADYSFASYARQLSQAFRMDEMALLLRSRPVLLALFYGLLCILASRVPGRLSVYLLLAVAAAMLVVAFPLTSPFGFRLPAALQEFINTITVSQLGLTFNLGGLILGFGLFQHLRSNKQ